VSTETINGLKKAAILMVVLGDEASASVFRYLQEDEVQEISKEISRLGKIESGIADSVLEDFFKLSLAKEYLARGGAEYARKLLVKAFGAEASKRLLDRLNITLQTAILSFDSLRNSHRQSPWCSLI
jgi:flagellar motor switch protein FliG